MNNSYEEPSSTVKSSSDERTQDELLLSRVRQGDNGAFRKLWLMHSSAVVRAVKGLASDEAEDVTSEAFLATWKQLSSGGGPQQFFRAYVIRVAKNMAAQHFHHRMQVITHHELDHLGANMPKRHTPESASIVAEEAERVNRVFTQLPERWQTVLHLQYVDGVTRPEIADRLNLKLNAVSALSRRARNGMRELWSEVTDPSAR